MYAWSVDTAHKGNPHRISFLLFVEISLVGIRELYLQAWSPGTQAHDKFPTNGGHERFLWRELVGWWS